MTVQRCVTRRVTMTRSAGAALQGVDAAAAALLLARGIADRALRTGAPGDKQEASALRTAIGTVGPAMRA